MTVLKIIVSVVIIVALIFAVRYNRREREEE
jgi:heme/copper-type cytochrome/quinol oxidase subunit 2